MFKRFFLVVFTVFLTTGIFAESRSTITPVSGHLHNQNKPKSTQPLRRTISLDTGYLPSLNSNRAIGEFDLELRQAWGALYDWQNDVWQPSDWVGRSILYSCFSILTWSPSMAQMVTYHEQGHSTRFRAIGIDTSFVNAGKAILNVYQKEPQNIGIEDVLSDSYFPTLFGAVAISLGSGTDAILLSAVVMRSDKDRLFTPKNTELYYNSVKLKTFGNKFKQEMQKKKYGQKNDSAKIDLGREMKDIFTPKTDVLIMAGGINNQQDQSRRVENHLWYNEGDHFTTVGTYFWDKTWAGFQSALSKDRGYGDNQDTTKICNTYQRMGIDLTHEEIIIYSYLSYFLSSQTYANIYQVYKTIFDGENKVYAPEFWNIKLPNVALYFTTKGPTYNVSSGYKYNDTLFFPISIEFGLKESTWEANVGIRKMFPIFHNSFVHAEIAFNTEAWGGSFYGGALISKVLNVQAGITYHDAKTFQGERNIPSYKNGDTDIEAWIKLGVSY